jgi:uncharacterized membrane protein YedE/YeeE
MTPAAAAAKKPHLALVVVLGAAFGFVLSGVGFTEYDELHKMLTFADLRMFLTFCGAVALSSVGYFALRNARPLPKGVLHKGTVPGGILFGIGWAVAGACPGVALAQLGQGKLWVLAAIAGIVVGTLGYGVLHARYFRFDRGSCG